MDGIIEAIRNASAPNATVAELRVGPTAHAIAALIRSTPPDQLLDLAISKLRAALPADQSPEVPKMNIPLVRIPAR